MKNIIHDDNGYIYESPDNGKTIYRRKVMEYSSRELVGRISGEAKGNKKAALVLGAGGFIGGHLVKRLKSEGYWVRGVDLKYSEYDKTTADDFIIGDLRDRKVVESVLNEDVLLMKYIN